MERLSKDGRSCRFCLGSVLSSFIIGVIMGNNPELSRTACNASSSRKTLGIMLTIGPTGLPIVIAYAISCSWLFRGKVQRDHLVY